MPKLAYICSAAVFLTAVPAFADDWTVTRLRGGVFSWNGVSWDQLERGSVVSDNRLIKSSPKGRATFVREAETIEVGPDTSIQIQDKAGFTTVYNHEGVVGVDAEARNVEHFAVETRFMAAVVKGTAFVVSTDAAGSLVAVSRGTVEVDDSRFGSTVNIEAGQAISSGDQPISLQAITPVPADLPAPPPPATPAASDWSTAMSAPQGSAAAMSGSAASLLADAPQTLSGGSENEGSRASLGNSDQGNGTKGSGASRSGNGNGAAGNGNGKGNGADSQDGDDKSNGNGQANGHDKEPKPPKDPKEPKDPKAPKEPKPPKEPKAPKA